RHLEQSEDLVEHLAMLRRGADDDVRSGFFAQPMDDRSHLDGLGARADDDEQLHVSMGPPGCGAAAGAARGGRACAPCTGSPLAAKTENGPGRGAREYTSLETP